MRRWAVARFVTIGALLVVVFAGGAYVAHKYWNQIVPSSATTTIPSAVACSPENTIVSWVPGSASAGTAYAWITAQYKGSGQCIMSGDWSLTFTGDGVDPTQSATESSTIQWSTPSQGSGSSSVLQAGQSVTVKANQVIWKEISFFAAAACPTVQAISVTWPAGATSTLQPTYLTSPCSASFPVTVSPTYVS
jgi:hypothetical protein